MSRLKLSWLLALVLLSSNALIAWHSGAHYFEYQPQTSEQKNASLHTQLCDVGVLAQAVVGSVATAFILPNLGRACFWQATTNAAQVFAAHHSYLARAPPYSFS